MRIGSLSTVFPCPTSSATMALVWFELKAHGMRVLAIGLACAVLIYLVPAMGIPFVGFRPFTVIALPVAVLAVPIFMGRNAFGIRHKQGRTYLSAFEAIQPCGTAQLAGVKLLVRTACVLVALVAIGISLWQSDSLVAEWRTGLAGGDPQADLRTEKISLQWMRARSALGEEFFGGATDRDIAELVGVLVMVVVIVAALAAFSALRARYPRRVLIAGSLFLVWLFVLSILMRANESDSLRHMVRSAMSWIVWSAILSATVYLLRSGFAQRALTIRYVCYALAISVANAMMSQGPAADDVLLALVLPLIVCILAPWSLNRVRHT